jgi:transposase
MYTLIGSAKLNNVDPQAWLAGVLRRIADHPTSRLNELLPGRCGSTAGQAAAA